MLGADRSSSEPRVGPDWFRPQPFFAIDVKDWRPVEPLRIDSRADGFPGPLNELKPGKYSIQAVVRLNRDTNKIGNGRRQRLRACRALGPRPEKGRYDRLEG